MHAHKQNFSSLVLACHNLIVILASVFPQHALTNWVNISSKLGTVKQQEEETRRAREGANARARDVRTHGGHRDALFAYAWAMSLLVHHMSLLVHHMSLLVHHMSLLVHHMSLLVHHMSLLASVGTPYVSVGTPYVSVGTPCLCWHLLVHHVSVGTPEAHVQ